MNKIETKTVSSLPEFICELTKIEVLPSTSTVRFFRGEPKDFKESALTPSIYRVSGWLKNEPNIYREMQRFNDQEFHDDKTTIDKLSRMQHYSAPTRVIDISEDALSALYFALNDQSKEPKTDEQDVDAVVYIIDVLSQNLCYYDSDTVSVVANLVKSPLSSSLSDETQKSQQAVASDALAYRKSICDFNNQKSIKFLLHDIKEEKPYFSSIINPVHIFSVQCVKPKFTNDRVSSQRGAFLLFGLNPENLRESIHLITNCGSDYHLNSDDKIQHPIKRITKIVINAKNVENMREHLELIGIKTPFIYPEMDKVADYLKKSFKTSGT